MFIAAIYDRTIFLSILQDASFKYIGGNYNETNINPLIPYIQVYMYFYKCE